MKQRSIFLVFLALPAILGSCSKSNPTSYTPSAAITITNAVAGSGAMVLNGSPNQNYTSVASFTSQAFPLLAGGQTIDVSDPAATPAITYFHRAVNITDKGNYSLFLAGLSATQADTIFITETFTNPTDSSCGVRFINLSPDSGPLSINITGGDPGGETPSLAYKAYTNFKLHSARIADVIAGIGFEIHDAATGNLLTTYTLIPSTFHNITLAIAGYQAGPSIIQINNF
jgi:hypothetical protein